MVIVSKPVSDVNSCVNLVVVSWSLRTFLNLSQISLSSSFFFFSSFFSVQSVSGDVLFIKKCAWRCLSGNFLEMPGLEMSVWRYLSGEVWLEIYLYKKLMIVACWGFAGFDPGISRQTRHSPVSQICCNLSGSAEISRDLLRLLKSLLRFAETCVEICRDLPKSVSRFAEIRRLEN